MPSIKILRPIIALLLITLFSSVSLYAQNNFDIYLIDYSVQSGKFVFRTPVNISSRAGYDSQPFFHPDGRSVFYSSQREGQTDIYQYDLRKSRTIQLTDTPDCSEYSPTITPDRNYFSVIQQLNQDNMRQPLRKFPVKGGEAEHIFENELKVGYHAWADNNTVVMFILGSREKPNTLQVYDTEKGTLYEITDNIGRCLHKIPKKDEISFTQRFTDNESYIKKIDMKTKGITTITQMLSGSQDYSWTPDRILIAGTGSKLFKYQPGKDTEWIEIADLTEYGIRGINRLAVSPEGNRLVLVAEDNPDK
ncbi:TolB family protein [candidate division KSB1 bacterium]